MPTNTMLIADNLSFAEAFKILEEKNLNQVEINSLIWGVLGETLGKSKRVFNFSKAFAAAEPACVASFARSFVHEDWIDGESVVQAGHSSIEEGFNSRFHKIEDDLDALAADVVTAMGCVGDMRQELAARLSEIRTEINRINGDVHACCNKPPTGPGVWPIDPGFVQPIPWPPAGGWGGGWGGPIGPIGPVGPVGPGAWPGGPLGPWGNDLPWKVNPGPLVGGVGGTPWTTPVTLEAMLKDLASTTYPGPSVTRSTSDPTRATVAGMPARRLDIKPFNGQPYEVWSTTAGIVMTPAPAGMGLEDHADRAWENPRAKAVGDVSAWVATKGATLEEAFREGTTVGAVIETFGDDRLDGGATLRDALSVLPTTTALGTPADLLELVADRAAIAVARDGMTAETLVANIGFNAEFKDVAEVPITEFKAVPVAVRTAMAEAGIATVGALAELPPDQLAKRLTESGIKTDLADSGRWTGEAKMMGKLVAPIRR